MNEVFNEYTIKFNTLNAPNHGDVQTIPRKIMVKIGEKNWKIKSKK